MSALTTFFEHHGLTTSNGVAISGTAGRQDLAVLWASLGYHRGAEIGVWRGYFSEFLCQTIQGLQLTCVDPWASYDGYQDPKNDRATLDDAYGQACARLTPYGCDIQRTTSAKAVKRIPDGSLDFVYLDGNHGEAFVRADLEAWTLKVRSGGIVAGHDYEISKRHKHLEVRAAVDTFVRSRQIGPLYVLAKDKSPSFFWVNA